MPATLHKRPDKNDPNDVKSSQNCDQPEVVWICTELLLINYANFSRHELLKDVGLENGRQAVHEKESANVS